MILGSGVRINIQSFKQNILIIEIYIIVESCAKSYLADQSHSCTVADRPSLSRELLYTPSSFNFYIYIYFFFIVLNVVRTSFLTVDFNFLLI